MELEASIRSLERPFLFIAFTDLSSEGVLPSPAATFGASGALGGGGAGGGGGGGGGGAEGREPHITYFSKTFFD